MANYKEVVVYLTTSITVQVPEDLSEEEVFDEISDNLSDYLQGSEQEIYENVICDITPDNIQILDNN